jgi:hypothetical protein
MEERRRTVRRLAGTLSCAAALVLSMAAQACELPPGTRLESATLKVSYRSVPAKIAVGEHFVLEVAACPKSAAALPEGVKLDARMPEHRHGMNYRPSLKALGAGRYRSEGWLFHMPGHWEFVFDFGAERLTHSIRIE